MSSSNTSWTTESNTKSGSVKVYSSDVSVLKVVAGEGGDALIDLFADQGDDNADKWRLWVNASDNDLHFSNYTSGTAWTDILTLEDGGSVGIDESSPSSYGKLVVKVDDGENVPGIFINIDDTGEAALKIDTEAAGIHVVQIDDPKTTTGDVLRIASADALTGGRLALFHSESSTTDTRSLVKIVNDHASATGATCLEISQDANQRALFIDQNGNNSSIQIDSETTTSDIISIDNAQLTSGKGLYIVNANALTSGNLGHFHSNSASSTTRELVYIRNQHSSATGATTLSIQQDSSATGLSIDHNNPITTGNTYAASIDVNKSGVSADGATVNTFGLNIDIDDDATNHANSTTNLYGLNVELTGTTAGTSAAIGVYSYATGADNNYPGIFMGGNVGIGITTPAKPLHVKEDNANGEHVGILIEQDGTGDSKLGFLLSGGQEFSMGIDNSTSGDCFIISDGADLNTNPRLTIDANGKVGIGVTAPSDQLTVAFADTGTNQLSFKGLTIGNTTDGTANNGAAISFEHTGNVAGGMGKIGAIFEDRGSGSEDTHLYFSTVGSGSHTEKMRIDSDGAVGINENQPENYGKLTVKNSDGFNKPALYVLQQDLDQFAGQFYMSIMDHSSAAVTDLVDIKGNFDDSPDGSTGMGLSFSMRANDDGNEAKMGRIASVSRSGTIGSSGAGFGADLEFHTISNGTLTKMMRLSGEDSAKEVILESGVKMGIGTPAPGELLWVEGASGLNGATPPTIQIHSSNSGTWTDDSTFARLAFGNDDTDSGIACSINAFVDSATGNTAGLTFYTSASANTPAERVRIDKDGQVGIGVTPGSMLHVKTGDNNNGIRMQNPDAGGKTYIMSIADDGGTAYGGAGAFSIRDEADNTVKLSIASDGKVAIGQNAAASQEFHVVGSNTTATALWTNCAPGNIPGIRIQNSSATDGNYAGYFFENDTEVVGGIIMEMETHTSDDSSMTFATSVSGETRTKMILDKDGKVGIGATDPVTNLDIRGAGSNIGGQIALTMADTAVGADETLGKIYWQAPKAGEEGDDAREVAASITAKSSGTFSATRNDTSLHFATAYSESATTKMIIDPNGNVGIGTTNPARQLEITNTTSASTTQGGSLRLTTNDGTLMQPGERLGFIEFAGPRDGTEANNKVGAMITAVAGSTWTSSDNTAKASKLHFYTQSDGTGTDHLAVANPRMTIDEDGKVSIGGNLQVDTAIYTNNITSGGDATMHFKTNEATTRLAITDAGNVGIGTDSPDGLLELSKDDTSILYITSYHDTENNSPGLYFRKGEGTESSHATPIDADAILGQVVFSGYDGNSFVNGAKIMALADENWAQDSASGTHMRFYTMDNTTQVEDERMRIDHNGHIGIGELSPSEILHLKDSGGNTSLILDSAASGSARVYLDADNAGDEGGEIYFQAEGTNKAAIWNHRDGILKFATGGSVGGSNTPHMQLDANGRLGIGPTTPSRLLHLSQNSMSDTNFVEAFIAGAGNSATRYTGLGVHYSSDTTGGKTNAPCSFLRMDTSDNVTHYIWCSDPDDDFTASTDWNNIGTTTGTKIGDMTSDERLKNISSDPFPYGLSEINKLIPIKYSMKKDSSNKQKLGFGAQTTKSIIPESVYDTKECIDGYSWESDNDGEPTKQIPNSADSDTKLAMSYNGIIPVLVKAIQELTAKVEALENK